MMWQWGAGPAMWGMWLGGGLLTILFWLGVALLIVWLVRTWRPAPPQDDALAVLRRRYAAGEISQEEYDRMRQVLER